MTKPDDIPQSAWDMALRFWRESGCSTGTAVPFARAIMAATAAEREACAVAATRNASPGHYMVVASNIASAIRRRGDSRSGWRQ